MKALTILFLAPTLLFAQEEKVVRINDGNTFETANGEKVRIIGINAPGINTIYGVQSKTHLQQLIGSRSVVLQADNMSPGKDSANIILRYVYLNNTDMGARMILEGYAVTWLRYPFVKSGEYKQAQLLAQNLAFGIWHNPGSLGSIDTSSHALTAVKPAANRFTFISNTLLKECFVGSVVLVLIFIGIYGYLRK